MSNVSTFSGYTMAKLAIYSSQKAMEVTGNNISNVNTEGYSRQSLQQKSVYMGGTDKFVCNSDVVVGQGARATRVAQLRDPYLDIRYRSESSNVGAMDAKLAVLEQLQGIFDEVGSGSDGEGVIEAQFNDMIEQMQKLVTSGAGRSEYDTLVRSSASALVTLFNSYAEKLETLKTNEDTSFKQDVTTVNNLLTNIRLMNEDIKKAQIHGSDALELQDERNNLIDQLSQYIRIDVSTVQEDIGEGQTIDKIVIKLAGGDATSPNKNATLVDGTYATQLSLTQVQKTDADGNPVVDAGGNPVMEDNDHYDISLSELKNRAGNVMVDDKGVTSTSIDLKDNDLYGALQAMREMLTESGEFASAEEIAKDPDAATKRGIPYYIKSLDSLVNKFATVLNEANTLSASDINGNYEAYYKNTNGVFETNQTGVTVTKDAGTGDYVRSDTGATVPVTDLGNLLVLKDQYKSGALFSNNGNGDDTTNITAGNIAISASWANGSVQLLQSKAAHEVSMSTDSSNLTHLLYLMTADQEYKPGDIDSGKDAKSVDTTFFKGSFQGRFTDIAAILGNDTKTTTEMLDNYTQAQNDLYVSREAVMGVDLNDEAVSMMQYQKSYSAACRLLTALDDMLETLISGTAR